LALAIACSLQWDHQAKVKRVYDLLTTLGLHVWMDISGGMDMDIYDSMAKAVSNASVVVCFMSQAYQNSSNCMLEVKFAKQSGVEIVPVLMQGAGWKASGWLGLLTAGALCARTAISRHPISACLPATPPAAQPLFLMDGWMDGWIDWSVL
jgi:hypothetical protein